MKIFIAALLCICLSAYAQCQDPHLVDSLSRQLLTSSDDTLKAATIRGLVEEYVFTKPDSCLYYTNMGLDLVKDQFVRNKFERAGMGLFELWMYCESAVALSELRNDSLAVRFAFKALQLAENNKDKSAGKWAIEKLGEVYFNIDEPQLAIDYFEKAIAQESSRYYQQIFMGNLGASFYSARKYDSALYYLHQVDTFFVTDSKKPWAYPHYILGKICIEKGDYLKAMLYFRTAKNYSEQSYEPIDICQAYLGIANAFKGMGMTDSALWYANHSLVLANKLSLPVQSLDASTLLSALYESKGRIDSAFKYQKISITLKDTLFSNEKIRQVQNFTFNEKLHQQEIREQQDAYTNKMRIYGLAAGLVIVLLFAAILIRNNRQKQKANALLQLQKEKVESTLSELKSTQSQLVQSEKMASLGELTAGIAHEIQNPLNFVNNFSEVNMDLIGELKTEIKKGNLEEVNAIAGDLETNEEKINHHGRRADAIVKAMLQHSRASTGAKEPTDINALADEYLRLAYHGIRAKDKAFQATIITDFDQSIEKINIIAQDIGRVLLNLYNNAFYAVNEKKNEKPDGYEPTISVGTKRTGDQIAIRVRDNGNGIPQKVIDKIFQPFFTTKPTGQGTGLGLSLSYDIVKAHGGEINVETVENEGSEFIIKLPIG